MRIALAAIAFALVTSGSNAHPSHQASAASANALASSARPAAQVVDRFHEALRRGDTQTAQSLLANGALIFEEGSVESGKAEYAAHHLGVDAAFSKAVPATVARRAGEASGNTAWIATEGRVTGIYGGKAIDRVTTETMVLRRLGTGWKIVHIHWSSGARP